MMNHLTRTFALLLLSAYTCCHSQPIQTGADQMNLYLPALQGKRVGLVVNHTSQVGRSHLVGSLIARGIVVKTIFAPEHGFRGQATDGETISNSRDPRTGVIITSLYCNNYKPTPQQMDSWM